MTLTLLVVSMFTRNASVVAASFKEKIKKEFRPINLKIRTDRRKIRFDPQGGQFLFSCNHFLFSSGKVLLSCYEFLFFCDHFKHMSSFNIPFEFFKFLHLQIKNFSTYIYTSKIQSYADHCGHGIFKLW